MSVRDVRHEGRKLHGRSVPLRGKCMYPALRCAQDRLGRVDVSKPLFKEIEV